MIFLLEELMENNQLNFIDWLMKYPRQIIILVLKIMFTRLIEQSSKGNDSEQVKHCFFLNKNLNYIFVFFFS